MVLKEILLPAMGEGVTEASIIRWLVKEGEAVTADQPLVEIATDKVDSEVPSTENGILKKIIAPSGSIPKVGATLAVIAIQTDGEADDDALDMTAFEQPYSESYIADKQDIKQPKRTQKVFFTDDAPVPTSELPFIPPFVRLLAEKLKISFAELASFTRKSKPGIFTKEDVENFILVRDKKLPVVGEALVFQAENADAVIETVENKPAFSGNYRVIEMSRIRRKIADNMSISSKSIPHVTSFIEVDVTKMVLWREKHKDAFQTKFQTKLTYTPLFIEAIVHALKLYPEINASLDGENIIIKEDLNIGMATVLPDKNLIVPVVMQADKLNLHGLASKVNDLADRARTYNLKPAEINGSTFTFTNVGVFGTLTGTPLINVPEAAILAIGAINKKPSAVLTPHGYTIGIRDIVMLSLAFDHRIIDGSLGGLYLKAVADFLTNFDENRLID